VAGEIARPTGAAGLQGWLRRFAEDGLVLPRLELDWSRFAACDSVFLSIEDVGGDEHVIEALRRVVPIVVCTHGRDGAKIYAGDEVVPVDAAPASEVDPTGAGDVFATAFLLARAGGADLTRAAAFAARAGAIAVEAVGVGALSRLASLTV
jgi:sugar/nucleoside kinase (ribokinase family)